MDPQLITTAAREANQVGLLTYLVVAITLFCGFIVVFVMITNNKREERLIRFSEIHVEGLGQKVDACKKSIEDSMVGLAEAARFQKAEHLDMITSLRKTTETLIALAAVLKMPVEEQRLRS